MHIYTSNGLIDSNNADHNPVVTHFVGWGGLMPNYTQICAEGWQLNSPGSYTLKGRPCVVVHT